jgi:hypothetical protein
MRKLKNYQKVAGKAHRKVGYFPVKPFTPVEPIDVS